MRRNPTCKSCIISIWCPGALHCTSCDLLDSIPSTTCRLIDPRIGTPAVVTHPAGDQCDMLTDMCV